MVLPSVGLKGDKIMMLVCAFVVLWIVLMGTRK